MLDKILLEYADSDVYPFHTPGHKRHMSGLYNPYSVDITEIRGFDDLHNPSGLIKDLEDELAKLYRCKKAWILVNGSTAGVLGGIFATTKRGDHVLLARNCHQSVYHAAILRGLRVSFLYPEYDSHLIAEGISPEAVEDCLDKNKDIKLVVLTSPTYEGVVSDIKSIKKISAKRGATLFIDSAHGAHLGFNDYFPESVTDQGADLAVVSLHKTLPFFTQTAALLMPEENIYLEKRIREYLRYFQSSSPSYILLAGVSIGIEKIKAEGETIFFEYKKRLKNFYNIIEKDKNTRVIKKERQDKSKILIDASEIDGGGKALSEALYSDYKIEIEMSTPDYCLALSSVMDTDEGFERLEKALSQITKKTKNIEINKTKRLKISQSHETIVNMTDFAPSELSEVKLSKAIGKISAGFVGIYPPGVPFLVPGEIIDDNHISMIEEAEKNGYIIRGAENNFVVVVDK